jgi:hypothetical protein
MSVDSGMWWTFGSLAFSLLFLVAIVWPLTSIWKSRAALTKEHEYHDLSDRSVRSLEGNERHLQQLQSNVTDLAGRLLLVERMLAEVD